MGSEIGVKKINGHTFALVDDMYRSIPVSSRDLMNIGETEVRKIPKELVDELEQKGVDIEQPDAIKQEDIAKYYEQMMENEQDIDLEIDL